MNQGDEGAALAAPLLGLRRALNALDGVSFWVIVSVMAAMAILVSLQVFYRYVLGSSIDSADELSRLFFVWAMFLAIPQGIRYSVHVGIDLVVRALKPRRQDVIFRVVSGAGLILMIIVAFVAWTAVADKWQELMPTLTVSAGLYYVPIFICAVHSALHLLGQALAGARFWGMEAP